MSLPLTYRHGVIYASSDGEAADEADCHATSRYTGWKLPAAIRVAPAAGGLGH